MITEIIAKLTTLSELESEIHNLLDSKIDAALHLWTGLKCKLYLAEGKKYGWIFPGTEAKVERWEYLEGNVIIYWYQSCRGGDDDKGEESIPLAYILDENGEQAAHSTKMEAEISAAAEKKKAAELRQAHLAVKYAQEALRKLNNREDHPFGS